MPPRYLRKSGALTSEITTASGRVSSDVMIDQRNRRERYVTGAEELFEAARLEILKGFRALLDARIEKRSRASRRGEKIAVE